MKSRPSRRPKTQRTTRQLEPRTAPAHEIEDDQVEAATPRMTIVGIGASAGGLEAFSQLLHALPPDPGLAIVFVQHLAPQHDSALASLLSMQTRLPVIQASDGTKLEPNHVYVIPPNVQAALREDGAISLMPRPTDRTQYTPIDAFLRSLADVAQEGAIAVILSGTASDGTQGVRDINAIGGFTFAQAPDTAKYDGMPRAAIATGLIDMRCSATCTGPSGTRRARARSSSPWISPPTRRT